MDTDSYLMMKTGERAEYTGNVLWMDIYNEFTTYLDFARPFSRKEAEEFLMTTSLQVLAIPASSAAQFSQRSVAAFGAPARWIHGHGLPEGTLWRKS